ncbi:porin family protein [Chryseobacterium sp. SC28]|uniref:porin family protein n=1 Tax=Chryseobacterium sp. SC28 TaxID=2268028 RepID=UPI000F64BAE2|nr:porin family protein [Chryseobacterium sp. SC28]RRQ45112.1 PorT family protein [Chryseobacterium sp. SC28]
MKRKLQVLAILISATVSSQSFGLKAGANVSTISKEKSWDDTNAKLGYYLGVYMHAPVNSVFSIQPEVLYNSVGVKYDSGDVSHTLSLDYISAPIMFQFEPIPNLFLEAGPQFSFLVGNSDRYKTDDVVTIKKYKNNSNYNSFDLGGAAGLGFKINNITIGVRYVVGFTDIKKSGSTTWSNDDKQLRNNAFQIGLQYGF